ncbi:MAG TPA: WecB/TagA/CpsF family glycosyltransferase [Azospirillaceae bacterium]|nr:WecB/TagA/CpsF family glycosyltransferase [Azospirillaceae bacterium]
MVNRVNILGIPVQVQTMAQAVARIASWIERRAPRYVCVTTVHGVMESQRDPALKAIHNAADMVTTDGMPLVWLCRAHGHAAERVYGPDLMLEICAASPMRGWRHFLYGTTDTVLDKLAANLQARFPGLCIAGRYAPPFRPLTEQEDAEVVERINAARPDIVWIGLSTPKQERWMAVHLGRVTAPVMIGVGAAFDFHAGTKRQAPRWMQRNGLEWLFRLVSEPRRLAYRYLVFNTLFLWLLAQQVLGMRDFPLAAEPSMRNEPP